MAPLLVEQLTAPVRFTHAGQALIREAVPDLVEVGPGMCSRGSSADRAQREDDLVSTPER